MPLPEGENSGGFRSSEERTGRKTMKREYPGMFTSSICDMFSNTGRTKTDACALTCCGIWLWERNQFLLQGTYPKSWKQRPVETLIVVLLIASAIIWTMAPSSLALQICLLIILVLGVWKVLEFEYSRSGFRHELAVEEYRRQSLANNMTVHQYKEGEEEGGLDTWKDPLGSTDKSKILSSQLTPSSFDSLDESQKEKGLQLYLERNWKEIHNPHSFIDFVRNDTVATGEFEYGHNEYDFCHCLWQCLSSWFCNTCCMCWCLCCGMCAVAQEHRHLVRVLPDSPELWQRDYITMQPWSDYFPRILQLRNTKDRSFLAHLKALSLLSLRLVQAIGLFVAFAIVVTLLPVNYQKLQLAVMFGILLEPIVLLFFVYWYWNRHDISTDAIIKYFASGFFLCTSSVFIYEVLASIGTSIIVFLYTFLGLVFLSVKGEAQLDEIEGDEGDVFGMNLEDASGTLSPEDTNKEFYEELNLPRSFIITVAVVRSLLHAFLVASLIEELLKYLSFWMVEHPDLENNVSLVPIPKSQQVPSEETEDLPPNEAMGLLPGPQTKQDTDSTQKIIMAMAKSQPHPVSLESRGAAITVAMVTVAIGFACAENFMYVFIYTEGNIVEEVTTLMIRSLFPIHPLCAAIQSIFVVKRDVEKDNSVGVGRIIFGAWLLHGAFDFLLMSYDAIMLILEGDNGTSDGDENMSPEEDVRYVGSGWIVLICSLLIPIIGLEYYIYQSRRQTKRLQELDSGRVSSSQISGDTAIGVIL